MDPLAPIDRADFLKLIERGDRQLDNEIAAGQVIYWGQPKRDKREPGKRYKRNFIGIDAVLIALADLYEEGGPHQLFPVPKSGLVLALNGMQLALPNGVDQEDAQMVIGLEDRHTMTVACDALPALERDGYLDQKRFVRSFRMPVRFAVQRVRARAKKNRVTLPEKFAPPPTELPLAAQGGLPWRFAMGERGNKESRWWPVVEMPLQVSAGDLN
ncbi:hypothetical protein [Bradyrhizobium stylosanthis]|uniref:hypothetical protein n=1 Tax=Bradyrhizobium stylosanthis TaxID=1803665 RepID=UPI000AA5E0F5|nr:hypothetical protein [Bradyrhizobium stylosanthis]